MRHRRQVDGDPPPPSEDGEFAAAILAACAEPSARAAGWRVLESRSAAEPWIEVANQRAPLPAQGWKLHVSAGIDSAEEVLRRALPVLLATPCVFKVAASRQRLYELNAGDGGPSQAGKFITVYPRDDGEAVALAVALDEATAGLRGPVVPSDRPLRPGSLVHYRYGGIALRYLQNAVGEVLPAIEAPDGTLVPDQRWTTYTAPDWAVDPFVAAGVVTRRPTPSLLIAGRYLAVAPLQWSARTLVRLVVDTKTGQRLVLKHARGDSGVETAAFAAARLRHEAAVLAALAPDPRFPRVHDLFEHEGDTFLVLEDCAGPSLDQIVMEEAAEGRLPATERVVAWGREIAGILATVHERGFIYRDLKARNVIVAPDRRLRLIDFETTYRCADGAGPYEAGTPGYVSPERRRGGAPAVTDDIYSLGAVLYFLTTSVEPSHAPPQRPLLDRPLALLNPAAAPALARVIGRCLAPDPERRYPSMEAVAAALAAVVERAPSRRGRAPGYETRRGPGTAAADGARRRYGRPARRLAETLCATALPDGDRPGLAWTSFHATGRGLKLRDITAGNAGGVLALAELVDAFAVPAQRAVLAETARWLAAAEPLPGPRLPGLYVGEAGIGAALLRAGQVLGDRTLIAAAEAKGRLVAGLPHASPDIFNGSAGRLRFHLILWDATGAAEHLEAALAAGEFLVAAAETPAAGERCWRIPRGYDVASGQAYLGYAHGAAGIADALLDLWETTGEERFAEAARGAARMLARLARPALNDGSGLTWADVAEGTTRGGVWCHGAAGVARFFLHAATTGLLPEAADLAARAARTAGRGARWAGPTQCHGLAGNIEVLLDMARATGEEGYLADALALARLLEVFAVEEDGLLFWSSETPAMRSPDYMVGYAGIAACLLRLSDPERRPHLLSRGAFRRARDPIAGTVTGAAPLTRQTGVPAAR